MDRAHISALRRMPAVRAIAKAWRDRASSRTLLACSGGADSSALVLALAAAISPKERAARLVVAHVVHDLRPRESAQIDAARARELAEFVGVDFVLAEVHPAHHAATEQKRNLEALARRERYAALAELARENGCDAIATAHHAGDQAETVLMRLLRGTGIQGLRAIHPSREVRAGGTRNVGTGIQDPSLRLIRPMLTVTRQDAEAICAIVAWQWGTDHTNADTSRTRAWLRHEVLPMLEARAPGAARRLANMASHAHAANDALRTQARELWRRAQVLPESRPRDPREVTLNRPMLRDAPAHIATMVLRHAIRHAAAGAKADRISAGPLARAVAIVQDRVGGERQIRLAGASLIISREQVRVMPAPPSTSSDAKNPSRQPPKDAP